MKLNGKKDVIQSTMLYYRLLSLFLERDSRLILGLCGFFPVPCHPKHVHLSLGDAVSKMVIMWATKGNCTTQVDYGSTGWSLHSHATGNSVQFWEQNAKGLKYLHRVELTVCLVYRESCE
jgi:hypothetical protein